MPDFSVPNVLYWLGVTYADRVETLPQAVFMFDWASRFGPAEYGALVEKQRCRLRLGQREELLREAQPPFGVTCAEVAAATAALTALGRRRKALLAAAERGVEVAREARDRCWQGVFEHLLRT
jgi:hypothetical protein